MMMGLPPSLLPPFVFAFRFLTPSSILLVVPLLVLVVPLGA